MPVFPWLCYVVNVCRGLVWLYHLQPMHNPRTLVFLLRHDLMLTKEIKVYIRRPNPNIDTYFKKIKGCLREVKNFNGLHSAL